MNNCSFIGRITQDVELKNTPDGIAVCSFGLAVARPGSKDKTDFFNVVAWRNTADFIARYFSKGQKIGIIGMLTTRAWLDKNQQKRIAVEIVANHAYFCEKSEGGPAAIPAATASEPVSIGANVENFEEIEDEEDLPF